MGLDSTAGQLGVLDESLAANRIRLLELTSTSDGQRHGG